jgi:hypothetical protein
MQQLEDTNLNNSCGFSGTKTYEYNLSTDQLSQIGQGPSVQYLTAEEAASLATNQLDDSLPTEFAINSVSPNPFSMHLNVQFSLPEATSVKISLFDLLGRQVGVLIDGSLTPGYHWVYWSPMDWIGLRLSSGTYLLRMQAGSFVETKTVVYRK